MMVMSSVWVLFFFFFQAEDGIRDWSVTGVQTCALPIFTGHRLAELQRGVALALHQEVLHWLGDGRRLLATHFCGPLKVWELSPPPQIGRASCRERGEMSGVGGSVKEKVVVEGDRAGAR